MAVSLHDDSKGNAIPRAGVHKMAGVENRILLDNEANNRSFSCAASIIDLWKDAGRDIPFTISGISMEPFLKSGDRVVVRTVYSEQLKRGDIIAFRSAGRVIIHRLMGGRKTDKGLVYCQKGDNLGGWTWIPEEAIIGKVVSIRGPKYIADMGDTMWRYLNTALGIWGTGQIAFKVALKSAKAALVGDNQMAYVSMLERSLRNALLPLTGCLLRLLHKNPK